MNDSGPSIYYPNDSFGSVLGEIKQALGVWNSVSSSNLRVAFGGLESQSQAPANTPGADIVFDDLPGLLGMGTPNLPVTPVLVNGPNGPFVPISRSTVILTNSPRIRIANRARAIRKAISQQWCMKSVTRSACNTPGRARRCRRT